MSGFSIDDVRESFTRDMNAYLEKIEEAYGTLLSSPALSPGLLEDDGGKSPFDRLGEASHGMAGTAGLVSAESLSSSARKMELLANEGRKALAGMANHATRARLLASLCEEGAREMKTMLTLELEKKGGNAWWLSVEWENRVNEALTGARLESIRTAAPDQDASPRTRLPEPQAGPRAETDEPPGVDGAPDELIDIVRAEAEERLPEMRASFSSLVAEGTPEKALALERVFHALKGATAIAGLSRASALAFSLQERLGDAAAGDVEMTDAFLTALHRDANSLLAAVQASTLPPLAEFGLAPPADSVFEDPFPSAAGTPLSATGTDLHTDTVGDELADIFREETREALVALQGFLNSLASDPDNRITIGHAERIYHTLKGSAATVGLAAVSELARGLNTTLQELLDGSRELTAELLMDIVAGTNQLARLSAVPGIEVNPLQEDPQGPPVAGAIDMRGFFLEEARDIVSEAGSLLAGLATASPEAAPAIQADLAKLFHRLKGAALVAGDQALAARAERLQGAVAVSNTAAMTEGLSMLRAQVFKEAETSWPPAATSPSGHRPLPRGSSESTREPVSIDIDPELWEAFQEECRELLEALDRTVLELETSGQPKQILDALMRYVHTLKGSVNTIGVSPTGRVLHTVEDFLEKLCDLTILPPLSGVANLLLDTQALVRKHLRTAREGFVEMPAVSMEERITAVLEGRRTASEPESAPGSGPVSGFPSAGSGRRSEEEGGAELSERRFVRVHTERLDELMNLAGELVVSRSRLWARIHGVEQVQLELEESRKRLVDAVERFREQYEFSLTGKRLSRGANPAGPAAATEEAAAFSELELDHYGDVQILARRVHELTSDINELDAQLGTQLGRLSEDTETSGGLVSGIQSEVMRIRMIPLDALFTRLRLIARDAAERDARVVKVVTEGENVSVDKTIADALYTPMLHLVRNAVAHGIESPEVRVARGKNAEGRITLSARQQMGQIVIEVKDDGAGLDVEALKARGVALGLVPPGVEAASQEVSELVFAPGVSTKSEAGDVSGRGVGGDTVRRSVEHLNGSVAVASRKGLGTVFTITLPLTLAISRALLVRDRDRLYAIPLYFSERILEGSEVPVIETAGNRRIQASGAYLPLRRLDDFFGVAPSPRPPGPILILRVGQQGLALMVDEVVAQEEIVVKNLGEILEQHPLFAGMTTRGAGDLVLIVDVPGLLEVISGGLPQGQQRPQAPEFPEEAPRRIPAAAEPVEPEQLRVLFVDDSLSVRKVAEKMLLGLGASVTLAVDGLDAMSRLREGRHDIIFTDLEMPRMHGYELIRELKTLPELRNLPVVVVSSRSGEKHQQHAYSLGASGYVTKPFTADNLASMIRRWVPGGDSRLP